MNKLEKRIIDLSYKYKLSHIGSCLTSVNIIDKIYEVKKSNEHFVLSNGHAGLALYVVLEKHGYCNAEEMLKKHGTHPSRDIENGIYVSTGSLGQGLPIAVGMALADKNKSVYVLISDGECAEGSIWEALRIASELRLENLRVTCVGNGYSAYGKVDVDLLDQRLQLFYPSLMVKTNLFQLPKWAQGLEAHYHVLTDSEYEKFIR